MKKVLGMPVTSMSQAQTARYYSISFPLISAGIFGGSLDNPVAESTKQCCRAFKKFTADYPMYAVDVRLCAFSSNEMIEAKKEFDKHNLVEV